MKLIFALIVSFMFVFDTNAEENVTKEHPCLTSSKRTAINLEAKMVKIPSKDVKLGDVKLIGNGGMLYLYSVFVESTKTGDNTHWEIVSEINYTNGSCKTVLSRRYWAH